jgi:hypothetical protein
LNIDALLLVGTGH